MLSTVVTRPALTLRRADPADVVALAALKRRVETRCYAHLSDGPSLAFRLQERCSAWYLLSRLGEGDLILVAELAGQLIGLAAAAVEPGPAVRLHSTYVEVHGYGAGRALTLARLGAAAELGIETVVADCLLGAAAAATRLAGLGMHDTGIVVPCPSFPGVRQSRWIGSVRDALLLQAG
jgi:hypothetical protein